MTAEQYQISAIVLLTLGLFIWGKIRHDLVAGIALGLCVLTGLTPAEQAFLGAGHPAVVTVAAVLILSEGLKRSGVVDVMTQHLLGFTEHPLLHVFSLTAMVAVASAFMNNVGALALMLPVALATARKQGRPPAMLLMPLAFGSILGGMMTSIGTPPNIIIASYRNDSVGQAFGMFDFTWVGGSIALLGVSFVALIGWRLIPKARMQQSPAEQLFEIESYLTEVIIPKDSGLIGQAIESIEPLELGEIELVGLAQRSGRAMDLPPGHQLQEGDILILQADPSQTEALLEAYELELITSADGKFERITGGDLALAEGIIQRGSMLEGRDVSFLRRISGSSLALVGLAREGQRIQRRLRRQSFQVGDILLLQGRAASLNTQLSELGMLPLAERSLSLGFPKQVALALLVFAAAIGLGVAGVLPLTAAFCLAILVYLLFKILTPQQLYEPVDWPVIVLLMAMIPVGQALENTGLTDLLATQLLGLTADFPLWVALGLILVVTMFLSDVINNATTAIVMAPIAMGVATGLGINPEPLLMAVAVGASCAFLTPIGHQSNTLVMGPGGYAFSDYWRMGLPLEILIVLVAVPMILWVWPP
ncbi:SLC13 family permease [Motiliproteus coralliicola]|uniref:SLC13 family permease n=1 Tax=Motiliproteus coralliicola TaxID=2283196 RepID=A0A369WRQ8_9GAMM|nr:SLC13 family permease [Motiliproteus coralliicola]RDE24347.1 SLC13 family permease [Motiliproteus coralliicola]